MEDAEIQGVMGIGTFEKVGPIWRQLIDGYGMQKIGGPIRRERCNPRIYDRL